MARSKESSAPSDSSPSRRSRALRLTDEVITEESREVSLFGGHFLRVAAPPRHVFGGFR